MTSENSDAATRPSSSPMVKYLHAIGADSTARPQMLSDGIFAVAMTILILDVQLPPLPLISLVLEV